MGILEDLPPTLRQRYFRHDRTPAHREEFLWQWMNAKNRDVAWAWKTVCMTSVTVSNSDCFPTYGHLKEHIDSFPSRTSKDFVGRFRAVMTTIDT